MVQKSESQSTNKRESGYKRQKVKVHANKRESGYKSQKVKVQTKKIYGTKMRSQVTHIKIINRALQ